MRLAKSFSILAVILVGTFAVTVLAQRSAVHALSTDPMPICPARTCGR